ncbi:MAG: DNA methyltransferase [Thermoplasmata archaeon]
MTDQGGDASRRGGEVPTDLRPLILQGNVLEVLGTLPRGSVHCVITSPPFWGLRRYDVCGCSLTKNSGAGFAPGRPRGTAGQITPDDPRCRKNPDPVCRWCGGTGTIPGMETLWGGSASCDHSFADTPARRPRSTADLGKSLNKDHPAASYDAKGGRSCSKCGAWFGSLGLEPTPSAYVEHMVSVFRALRPVLRDDATVWCELGDTYITHPAGLTGAKRWKASGLNNRDHTGAEQAGSFDKRFGAIFKGRDMSGHVGSGAMEKVVLGGLAEGNLALIPHRVAIALQEDGWVVRQDNVWARGNPMPESVRNRTTRSHSYIFQIVKGGGYYYDRESGREENVSGGRSRKARGTGKSPGPAGPTLKPVPPVGSGVRSNDSYSAMMTERPSKEDGRNMLSVWTIAPHGVSGNHYAVFPEAIPRRCIAVGTSERGCCPECGAPFSRVTSLGAPDRGWQASAGGDAEGENVGVSGMSTNVTVGWTPTCGHYPDPCDLCGTGWTHRTVHKRVSTFNVRVRDAKRGIIAFKSGMGGEAANATDQEIEEYDGGDSPGRSPPRVVDADVSWPGCKCRPALPAIILDIFAGSGTSLVAARSLYRRSIGIELNAEYVKIAEGRIAEECAALSPKAGFQSRLEELGAAEKEPA